MIEMRFPKEMRQVITRQVPEDLGIKLGPEAEKELEKAVEELKRNPIPEILGGGDWIDDNRIELPTIRLPFPEDAKDIVDKSLRDMPRLNPLPDLTLR